MTIPNNIKVGGFVYDIERKEAPFAGSNGAVLDGEHSFGDKHITVSRSGCEEYQNLVFLHEVCHAIIDAYVSQREQDEAFVEQFSKGLYQVIVDNPQIFGGTENDRQTDC